MNREATFKIRDSAPRNRWRATPGFSLIELLICVAIILILSAAYFGPSNSNRQQALRAACQKNLQKVYVSMEIYANEHNGAFPVVSAARTSEEALDSLIPRYTSDPSVFICPGSKDPALASVQSLRGRRISYAYYMGCYMTNATQVLMSDQQVDTQAKMVGQAVFSVSGKGPGNNHGKFGGNFLFCDGRTEMSPALAKIPLTLGDNQRLLNP